jgi:tellurite resistance protein
VTSLSKADAFAAVALAAVCWDGVMSMAGSRSLRHALDYRLPFREYGDDKMLDLFDRLLNQLREKGAQHLMVEAATVLNPRQRSTAFAMASEIMRSDGELQDDERNILSNLASVLELDHQLSATILNVMDVLHGSLADNERDANPQLGSL